MRISVPVRFICMAGFDGFNNLAESSTFGCSTIKSAKAALRGVGKKIKGFQILHTWRHCFPLEALFANHLAFLNLNFLICKMGIVPTSLKSVLRVRNATRLSNCRKKQSLRLKLDTLHAEERLPKEILPASLFSAWFSPTPTPPSPRSGARFGSVFPREASAKANKPGTHAGLAGPGTMVSI